MSAVSSQAEHQQESVRGGALGQLGSLLQPWRLTLAVVVLLVIFGAVLELAPPLLLRTIIDEHLTPRQADGLLVLALLYLGATAAGQAASASATYLVASAAQGALHALRTRLFAHLQRLPVSYYDRTPLGDIISRCTADVETLDVLFSTGVANVAADLLRLVTVALAMVVLSLPLTAVSALVIPPLVAITRFFQVRVRDAERLNRQAVGLMNTYLQETLSGVEVVQAFGREEALVARFRRALRQSLVAFNRATGFAALYAPATALLAAVTTALLLWAGTRDAFASWEVSLGTLTAFVLLFQRFFKPITTLGDEWQTVQSALSGAERIFQVLATPLDEAPPARDMTTGPAGGRNGHAAFPASGAAAELRAVSFGYLPGRLVLAHVTLAVQPGEHVALIGRTGAGKSSALHLLSGLYPPWSGYVLVTGNDPRALAPDQRRRVIGVVPQAVQLFSGTVFKNLTLFDQTVERETVLRAAAVTGADLVIQGLPQGFDTPLRGAGRGGGMQLSAGQQQLLALTRALVWEPAFLLLDEATAAVDGASDATLRAALRSSGAQRGCGVLTVAHRLSTAREADRVLVLDAGQIVEEGRPEELLRRGGRFAALVELEAAGWDWRASASGQSTETAR